MSVFDIGYLQNEAVSADYSTKPNLKPQAPIFKKEKWKKREELYKKLSQSLDARLIQLSSGTRNQILSQRRDQLFGSQFSPGGGSLRSNSEDISRLESQVKLLKGPSLPGAYSKMDAGKHSTSDSIQKYKGKLKAKIPKHSVSDVIHKSNRKHKAKSVINYSFSGDVQKFVNDLKAFGSDTVFSNRNQRLVRDKIRFIPEKAGVIQETAKKSAPEDSLKGLHNIRMKEMWDTGHTKYEMPDKKIETEPAEKDLLTVQRKKRKGKHKKDKESSAQKVVSKPAHVKSVSVTKAPVVTGPADERTSILATADVRPAADERDTAISDHSGDQKLTEARTDPRENNLESSESVKTKGKHKTKKKLVKIKDDLTSDLQIKAKRKSSAVESDDLSPYLNKIALEGSKQVFNQDFRSFVEACCSTGLYQHALDSVRYYRERLLSGKERFTIKDVEIYNSIIRCLAEKGDLKHIKELSSAMNTDGVKPNLQTYAMSLYCLSQMKDFDHVLAQFMVAEMEREGLDVKDIFTKLTLLEKERQGILTVLEKIFPGFEPPTSEDVLTYKGPLVEELNHPLPKSEKVEANPYIGVTTPEEIMKKADIQFNRELENYVHVKSILKSDDSASNKHQKQKKELKRKLKELRKQWKREMTEGFRLKLQVMKKNFYANKSLNLYPFFKLLPEEVYIDLLLKEIEYLGAINEFYSPASVWVYRDLAQKVCNRYDMQCMAEKNVVSKLKTVFKRYTETTMDPDIENLNHRTCWLKIQNEEMNGLPLEKEERHWSLFITKALGKELYDIIFSRVKVPVHEKGGKKKWQPAFFTVIRQRDMFSEEEIKPHPEYTKLMQAEDDDLMFQTSELPMLVPPLPWVSPTQGGNFFSTGKTIRWHLPRQLEMFKEAKDTGPVLDSLNILGACPWKVNKPILDLIIKVFNDGGDDFLDIPILPMSIEKPRKPKGKLSKEDKVRVYTEKMAYQKRFNEASSLWYHSLYRFSIANMFRDEIFWFPHSMDFRGRTYAIPPHFNHLGGDASRGIIKFAKGKELGPKGLDWLKIHLINLTGLKKKCSLADRLAYANEMMDEILDSADSPLEGRRWWTFSEEPWQTLACCKEIADASRSEDPAKFVSYYPVHQDGSCNGLQHYAALGRDTAGAKSVNLYPFDTPSDVYQEVVELVEQKRKRDLDSSEEKIREAAKICEGHVERKVIKQTIMTTVYGVTKYGARQQIAKQLKERGMPKDKMLTAKMYMAESTFECLQQMFASAKQIQDWFNACAVNICSISHKPVEWETPLYFPVIQPYFRHIRASSYGVSVTTSMLESQYPSVIKQKNAFAPNYIHSLDSTHMMLTSLFCLRAGITFVSVHDCFWTHPCDVEVLNKVTREQFVSLHNQPILENLSAYFVKTFCDKPKNELELGSFEHSPSPDSRGNLLGYGNQSGFSPVVDTDQSNNSCQELDSSQSDIAAELIDSQSEINQSNNAIEISPSDIVTELGSSKSDIPAVTVPNLPPRLSREQKMILLRKTLTGVPKRGDFDLEKVIESTYFFS